MWHHWDGLDWGLWGTISLIMFIGMGLMLLFWIVVIGIVFWAISRFSRSERLWPGRGRSDPLQIARERYARGEISREEFERIKKDLSE